MLERLVPETVFVASSRVDELDAELFAEEEPVVRQAVEKRRLEFTTGRACARRALEGLGLPRVAIPSGERGEPVWPDGVVGSITHCAGYRASAVARAEDVLVVGIDAEVHDPLPPGVWEQVAFGRERSLAAAGVHLDRVLFSAKEAVYKAWFPLTGRWLGFEDADLALDVAGGTFRARLLVPGPVVDGVEIREFGGRWCVDGGLVAAAVTVLPAGVSR